MSTVASTARMEKKPYRVAEFGPNSPLPDLHNVSYVHSQVTWDDSLTEEDVRFYRYGRIGSILPYLDQNGYSREKTIRNMDTVVLRNDRVKAEFLPWMGGRLWSLEVDGKEVLSKNPVVQPCNLALRNAWCSGGVEWNVSIRGHNLLTCEPLFTELLELEDGTAGVRFYEYERVRGIVYRLEAYLPQDSAFLFVQVHIENPKGNGEVPMYWWSNIAVPEEKETRVVTPAETAIISTYGDGHYQMTRREMPLFDGMDVTRPANISYSIDVFFDLLQGKRPFITALGKDHSGLVQCSTARELGRKLFVWGMGNGGRHWQEFLSDGKTSYIEIQAGITKTQQDHIPMPEGTCWEWLEAYGKMDCDLEGLDNTQAWKACETALEKALPENEFAKEFANRGKQIAHAHGKLVSLGSGWGALANKQREILGLEPISAVCVFPAESLGEQQKPWLTLLMEGQMDEPETMAFPSSYLVEPFWKQRLQKAPDNALCSYFLGVIFHSEGHLPEASAAFERSLAFRENAPAHRALGRMDALAGREESCIRHYERALALTGDLFQLQLEYAQTLLSMKKWEELMAYLESLSQETQEHPRFIYLKACAQVALGHYDDALELMLSPLVIPDMREGELSLSDLWFTLYMKKENLTRQECEKLHPLPRELDFRMH